MKKLLIIFLAISFISCNPFISKDLRIKNKCNRKLARAEAKFKKKVDKIDIICPNILTQDTIRDTLTITIPEVRIDSFIVLERDSSEIDSLVSLIKNKKTREIIREYITKYIPIKDTVIHLADGYTIKFYSLDGNIQYSINKPVEVIEKTSAIVVDVIKPIELSTMEKIINWLSKFWIWLILLLISFLLLRFIYKRFL